MTADAATEPRVPLLRAPPFPGTTPDISATSAVTDQRPIDDDTIDRVFALIRDAQVGGTFWAPPIAQHDRKTIIRARSAADLDTGHTESLWLFPEHLARDVTLERHAFTFGDVDPWSVLAPGVTLMAHGDDEWIALALIAGAAVQILSPGAYGAPGMTLDALRRRAAHALLGATYYDPFTGAVTNIEATIATLALWRRIAAANRDIVAACGIAWWKRHEVARFLWSPGTQLRFFRSERRALAHAARSRGAIAIWPSRISPGLVERAKAASVPLIRIEDGFVRSVGLGSNLVPPSSITVDRLGIHYDPSRASELEVLLAETAFTPELIDRAQRLRGSILAGGISKYGSDDAHAFPERQPARRLVLVPGQVEDDMSVQAGGGGLASNLELLRRARALEPDAEIWFRPHPDVDAGHRKGAVRDEDALLHADRVVRGGGMADLLALVDAVHVLTSLTGFETLLRGKQVTCHGTPFYAGWGLTRDLLPTSDRRGRDLTLDQLVAGVLILYPRYLDPVAGLPCAPETLIARVVAGAAINRLGWATRLRQWQGRVAKGWA